MSDLFFIASKTLGYLLDPFNWIVILLIISVISSLLNYTKFSYYLTIFSLIFILAIGFFPLGQSSLLKLESKYPVNPPLDKIDGIIVLGGTEDAAGTAFWRQIQLGDGAERFTEALALARSFPNAKILFTGGSAALRDIGSDKMSGAVVAERFFLQQGLSQERLVLERLSRNTSENAKFSFDLVQPKTEERWVLITSAFHMSRAMKSFEKAGWTNLVPYPVDFLSGPASREIGWSPYRNLALLGLVIREYIGSIAYWITGR